MFSELIFDEESWKKTCKYLQELSEALTLQTVELKEHNAALEQHIAELEQTELRRNAYLEQRNAYLEQRNAELEKANHGLCALMRRSLFVASPEAQEPTQDWSHLYTS